MAPSRDPMTRASTPAPGRIEGLGLAVVATLALAACEGPPSPVAGSPEYTEAVIAFQTGVAAIQVGQDERAETALGRVAELAPREPAAAANLAILALQQGRHQDAARFIDQARERAPDDVRVLLLAAVIERANGRLDSAIEDLRRALELGGSAEGERSDPRAAFLLVRVLEERGGPGDDSASRETLDSLLAADPADAFLLVESARHAARHDDGQRLLVALQGLEGAAPGWPQASRTLLDDVRRSTGDMAEAGARLTALAASLEVVPSYARQRGTLAISESRPDLVIPAFLLLANPSLQPPPPDVELSHAMRVIDAPEAAWTDAQPFWIDGEASAAVALLAPQGLWIAGDTGVARRLAVPPAVGTASVAPSFAAFDLDRDFRMDLALAGAGGLRVLRQDSLGRFTEVDRTSFPEAVRRRPYGGVWAADIDMDGDMDLVLGAPNASPTVLRNRADGTFEERRMFDDDVTDVRRFVWGDLDDDGDPDAVLLDGDGRVHVFDNPRQDLPAFVRRETPDSLGPAEAVTLGDLDADGTFDLLVLRTDGVLIRAWTTPEGWRTREVGRWPEHAPDPEGARLIVADLDNNSALDVAASASGRTRLWLADGAYALSPQESLDVTVTAAADLAGGGHVDLVGIDADGRPVRLVSRPSRDYYGLTIGPRAANQPGDGRINTFGIGGEAEVRAGLLYQKQPITAATVHFGIGDQTGVTVARIIWPNGASQAEFDLLASQGGPPLLAQQRLKGSCPWLFAFDGSGMRFVTDLLWRTAVGLRINTYGYSSIIHSQDWVKIRGDQLAARDGVYPMSITAELWESHFFDHIALMVVDHPVGTEVLLDERFMLPPPDLKVHATGPLRPVAAAWDDQGTDVTSLVADADERYMDTFELGEYQGVTGSEHALEIDLGPEAPVEGLLLVAEGWVYPTDGSINFAIGQGRHALPRGLRVEVADARGGWRVVHADLGMPAGKTKTVLVDLDGVFTGDAPRRVRLVTNMEIYWDRISWTEARPDTELRSARLLPLVADLRFRGYSRTRQAGRKAPEIPYYELAGTAPNWRDLHGYYTRYGDLRPLLREVDDRYVIMNSRDEMVLRFEEQPPPPDGWTRDFVLISDGWVKDGDLNNGYSGTLIPLPYHGMVDYSRPPQGLENDPVYRSHPDDWREYHTRYVTSSGFQHALSQR